jgi:DNA-binding NtrC family response regulator
LDKYASKRAKDTRLKFSPAVLQAFQYYHWPGNVRQLEHTVEQLAIMSHSVVIDLDDLPSEIRSNIPINLANSEQEDTAILLPMAEVAYLHAQKVLSAVKGNKAQASRILDIDRKTLDRILSRAKETN